MAREHACSLLLQRTVEKFALVMLWKIVIPIVKRVTGVIGALVLFWTMNASVLVSAIIHLPPRLA
jgi:hypothetical protein